MNDAGAADQRSYRSDVDGLRALAVLLVMLYHLRVPGFGGGFVGVDVFFVISGFVVTRVIAPSIATGEFSLLSFYKKRFWRLQPAFFLVLVAVIIASRLVLAETDVLRTAQSGLSASVLSANFYFWLTTSSYASDLAEQEPLLHMWSLAVEEQFYLLWPTLLMLSFRVRWLRHPAVIAAVLLGSIGLSEWLARAHPSLAYYLLPSRLMELGLGAVLVATERHGLSRGLALLAGAAGLGLVIGSAVLLDQDVTFPGVVALLPCVGTALLIQAGQTKTPLSWLFENGVAQHLGRVSYTLYLWHWPPIALANYMGAPLTPELSLAIGLGAVVVASTTYRFWETPTRRAPTLPYRYATFALGVLALAVLVSDVASPPHSVAQAKRDEDSAVEDQPTWDQECLLAATGFAEIDKCSKHKLRKGKRLLIWGDSHANVYRRSLRSVGEKLGWVVTTITRNGCPPIVGVHRIDKEPRSAYCTEEVADRIVRFIKRNDFDAVLLAARYGMYERGWYSQGKLVQHRTHFIADAESQGKTAAESAQALRRGLLKTAKVLDRQTLIMALPTPVMPKAPKKDRSHTLSITRAEYSKQRGFIERTYKRLPEHVVVFEPMAAVCDATRCPGWIGDEPLYTDDNHLSNVGYKRLAPMLKATLDALPADARR